MTQEIKDKLEQAAAEKINGDNASTFALKALWMDGAQTILENPAEWGLETTKEALTGRNRILSLQLKNTELQSQLAKYREALDKITQVSGNPISSGIAKEALKQETQND